MPLTYNDTAGRYENANLRYGKVPDGLASSIGFTLGCARKLRGLTQSDTASLIGVRQTSLSNYERGVTAIDAASLASLSLQMQYDPDAIIGLDRHEEDLGIDGRLRAAMLAPTCTGAWWPSGHKPPKGAYTFAVFERSQSLSLAVVKTVPDEGRIIDPSTDRLRVVVCGDASDALHVLELELRADKEYLSEHGFAVTDETLRGITLERPKRKGRRYVTG